MTEVARAPPELGWRWDYEGSGLGGQGVQGGLRVSRAISEAAGAGDIHTQLTVVTSDVLWAGREDQSAEPEPETCVVQGAAGQVTREGLLRRGPGMGPPSFS